MFKNNLKLENWFWSRGAYR